MRKYLYLCFGLYAYIVSFLFFCFKLLTSLFYFANLFAFILCKYISKKSREQELRVNKEMQRWAKEQLAELANPTTNSTLELVSRAVL